MYILAFLHNRGGSRCFGGGAAACLLGRLGKAAGFSVLAAGSLAAWEVWESGGLSFIDPAPAGRDALHVPFCRQKGTEKPPPIPTRRPHGQKGPAGPFGNPRGKNVAK